MLNSIEAFTTDPASLSPAVKEASYDAHSRCLAINAVFGEDSNSEAAVLIPALVRLDTNFLTASAPSHSVGTTTALSGSSGTITVGGGEAIVTANALVGGNFFASTVTSVPAIVEWVVQLCRNEYLLNGAQSKDGNNGADMMSYLSTAMSDAWEQAGTVEMSGGAHGGWSRTGSNGEENPNGAEDSSASTSIHPALSQLLSEVSKAAAAASAGKPTTTTGILNVTSNNTIAFLKAKALCTATDAVIAGTRVLAASSAGGDEEEDPLNPPICYELNNDPINHFVTLSIYFNLSDKLTQLTCKAWNLKRDEPLKITFKFHRDRFLSQKVEIFVGQRRHIQSQNFIGAAGQIRNVLDDLMKLAAKKTATVAAAASTLSYAAETSTAEEENVGLRPFQHASVGRVASIVAALDGPEEN